MLHPSTPIIPPGFASHALQLLQKVQHGISPIELVYTTHEHWPFRPGKTTHTHPTLHISVLDSSFNPPTLAHLALAKSHPPSSSQCSPSSSPIFAEPYDARMLLLSVRNADKVLKPGDATFVQRLEMMHLLSHVTHPNDSDESAEASGESLHMGANVAVAIIDEPTFVRKSTVSLCFLRARLAAVTELSNPQSISDTRDTLYPLPSPKLTFLLGFDTLVRLFSPRYYPSEHAMVQKLRSFFSPHQEDCHIVCAYRRNISTQKPPQEAHDRTLELADEFIAGGRIAFIDIGAEEQTYSSSEVRAKVACMDGKWKQMVPDLIANYVVDRNLYSGPGTENL